MEKYIRVYTIPFFMQGLTSAHISNIHPCFTQRDLVMRYGATGHIFQPCILASGLYDGWVPPSHLAHSSRIWGFHNKTVAPYFSFLSPNPFFPWDQGDQTPNAKGKKLRFEQSVRLISLPSPYLLTLPSRMAHHHLRAIQFFWGVAN